MLSLFLWDFLGEYLLYYQSSKAYLDKIPLNVTLLYPGIFNFGSSTFLICSPVNILSNFSVVWVSKIFLYEFVYKIRINTLSQNDNHYLHSTPKLSEKS